MSYIITCPVCGPRDGYEFRFGGEVRGPRPEEEGLTPEARVEYVHHRDNAGGPSHEWWYHRDGCGSWFKTWRDTLVISECAPPEGEEGGAE